MGSLIKKLRLYYGYAYNLIRLGTKKLIYKDKFIYKKKQCFKSGLYISIQNQGKIFLDEKIECRNQLYILAHGGTINIGKHCFFNTNCSITSINKIVIGDECKFGNNIVIVDHDHNYKKLDNREFISSPVTIGNNTWIGANCVILRGAQIGDNCVIAAGSVVKGIIPSSSLYYSSAASNTCIKSIS